MPTTLSPEEAGLPVPPSPGPGGGRGAAIGKLALLALGLTLAGWLLRELGAAPGTAQGAEWVDRFVRGKGLWGEAVFVLAGAAATAVGVPRQSVAFLGGYAFGAAIGSGLALLAQILGCAAGYFWARLVGGDWVERRLRGGLGQRLLRLRDRLRGDPFRATLALRLLPVGNNLLLNLLAGLAGIAAGPFLLGSLLGYVPQTVIFALLGDGVAVDRRWQLGLGAGLLVLSVLLGLRMLRRDQAGRDVA
ncbi:VTT domain-containing protein [Roseomonas sp. NAR14]|uniref:TVP38/TMEM64 family membrane protein n=1 Tax=Roseomonas acroporae TaxID=2937791 RepID=A0A9X1Y7P3_9PROT|nr:VTT domain-containing protein [Roseomonas acroporae]MCK8785073.1 VTT domain-containing protein [Roseomonas acroporae]